MNDDEVGYDGRHFCDFEESGSAGLGRHYGNGFYHCFGQNPGVVGVMT